MSERTPKHHPGFEGAGDRRVHADGAGEIERHGGEDREPGRPPGEAVDDAHGAARCTATDLTAHPLLPAVGSHVVKRGNAVGTCYWTLGKRKVPWSKELRTREDALRHFLDEMSGHETLTEIRRLKSGR